MGGEGTSLVELRYYATGNRVGLDSMQRLIRRSELVSFREASQGTGVDLVAG